MPPFDREGALKKAEKALRQGRIDSAIEEYLRIVEAQPRDWNSANMLGDLYVRAGQIDKGVAQYTRIADHLANEGFYPKAIALFKKILKIKPDDEYALLQSGDLAAKQGLLADAKSAYRAVAERRRARGDRRGAAEISIKMGTLDPEDLEARLGAARAATEIDDTLTALREFTEVAKELDSLGRAAEALAAYQAAFDLNSQDPIVRRRLLQGYAESGDLTRARAVASGPGELKEIAELLQNTGRADEALDVLTEVARLDPSDLAIRGRLAQAYVDRGDLARAREYLTAETAAGNPAMWLTLAELEVGVGRLDEAKAAAAEALKLDPAIRDATVALGCRLAEQSPDAAYRIIDAVADFAVAAGDFAGAAAALVEFTRRVPHHVIALMRLVDICVDAGLESTMQEAQAHLADAYLEVGRGLEARIISEDLVSRDPLNRAHIDRFRRALAMMGESNPDEIIAERLSGESPFLGTEMLDLNEGISFEEEAAGPPTAAVPPPPPAKAAAPPRVEEPEEEEIIDLNGALEEAPADKDDTQIGLGPVPPPARSLDQVFRGMRDDVSRGSAEEAAAEHYRLALTYRDLGMFDDAVKSLEQAARSPRQRFDACSLLGRLYLERRDTHRAVEWFERAAEAPAPTPDAGRALLYDLAETLENLGEHARALAVFVELESESGGYRDVAGRIERLSKVQAKG